MDTAKKPGLPGQPTPDVRSLRYMAWVKAGLFAVYRRRSE
jgi:hypothetical protein